MNENCVGPECDRQATVTINGLRVCTTHYGQARKGQELKPRRTYNKSVMVDGKKVCNKCDEAKPLEDFYLKTNGKYRTVCDVCWTKDIIDRRAKRIENNRFNGVLCSVEDCNNPVDLKGLCSTHYHKEWSAK